MPVKTQEWPDYCGGEILHDFYQVNRKELASLVKSGMAYLAHLVAAISEEQFKRVSPMLLGLGFKQVSKDVNPNTYNTCYVFLLTRRNYLKLFPEKPNK